ncbi:S-layer family protein, partial [Limnohabitans sp. Rim28]|uniref:beta strand repeat-containing protein n=1 Tax=Limnohabitans sp. Rim28 TaxID=1100720 RepID=UPI001056E8B2
LVANPGASAPGGFSRISSIEAIDLASDSASNTLKLSARDVQDMAGMNLIRLGTSADGQSWASGTYTLQATMAYRQLVVTGDAGDAVNLDDNSYASSGTVTAGGTTYNVYTSESTRTQVFVQNGVTMQEVLVPTLSSVVISATGASGSLLNAGDVVTVTATYSEAVNGQPTTAPTLTIGSETGITLTPLVTTGNTRIWTYTITNTGTTDTGSIAVVGNMVAGLTDTAGNAVSGSTPVATGSFTADTTAPTLLTATATPTDLTGLSVGETVTLTLTFSESVSGLTSGSASGIFTVGGNAVSATWAGSGNTRTLTYTVPSGHNGQIAIDETVLRTTLLAAGMIDTAGNALSISGAIADIDATPLPLVDTLAPTLLSSTPADQDFLRTDANITLTFGEAIELGTGTITLKALDGAADVVIDVANHSAQLSISGNTLTINPTAALEAGKQYAVQISSTAIRDTAGTAFAGLADTTTLNFATLTAGNGVAADQVAKGYGGFVVNGAAAGDELGSRVTSVGDVNGDGFADFVVSAPFADASASGTGRAYVVFGKAGTTPVNVADLATAQTGFAIHGEAAGDKLGWNVSSAGDLNGDGLGDVLIGAYDANGTAGRAYVVYGKTDSTTVELSDLVSGTNSAKGFVLNGQFANDHANVVAGLGDFNGDGFDDLLVSAPLRGSGLDPNDQAGRSYVVLGRSNNTNVDLQTVGSSTAGFQMYENSPQAYLGLRSSAVGDVNGDGLADLVLGSTTGNNSSVLFSGRSYVVFGRTGSGLINLSDVLSGNSGFAINGESYDDRMEAPTAAGDVNGDGLADLAVAASKSDPGGRNDAGRVYVVFGKTNGDLVHASNISAGTGAGYVINGESADDQLSEASHVGDVNGDGLADLLVGAWGADTTAGSDTGKAWVVYGKTTQSAIELSDVSAGIGGFAIHGAAENDELGISVSAAGDINGDGFSDLLVGAYGVNNYSGRAYVIFGGQQDRSVVDFLGTASANSLTGTSAAETFAGGDGNDTISGGGGSDVIWAGRGDDTVVLNSANVTALQSALGAGGNTTQLARVDGGTGFDTLRLNGSHLDLTLVANPGASAPGGFSRISSIEAIDLASDSASNT